MDFTALSWKKALGTLSAAAGLLLASAQTTTWADENCEAFQHLAKEWNLELPQMIDEATQLTMVTVNCETKTISNLKTLLVDSDLLADGWQARKQEQHMQLHCNLDGLASNIGWTARDQLSDSQGRWLVTLVTTPADCS